MISLSIIREHPDIVMDGIKKKGSTVTVSEIIDLDEAQQQQFLKESGFVSHVLKQKTQCDKLNVAALGNMVKQLHIHHVARFTHDVAWPKPVWGNQPACPYHIEKASVLISTYRESLALFY